ncbi:hypothetical protein [Agrococcus sp. ProA11]|uniref:hypothetical protein n=1 Tax=Agrococcus chionoecetis TaxID=3153752 RepID=UPI003260FE3A
MNAKDRLWSLGAALLAVGVALGGWFGAISPSLDAAARADDDRSAVEAQNMVHETRLIALEEAAVGIDALHAEHDALVEGLPSGEEYAAFLRQVDALAQQSGVTLSGVTTDAAMVYLPPLDETAPPPAESPAEPAEPAEGDDAEAPAPAAAPEAVNGAPMPFTSPLITGDNLAAIPVTVSAMGSTEQLSAFLNALQMGTRLISVSSATFTEPTAADVGQIDPAADPAQAAPAQLGAGQLDVVGFLYAMPTEQPAP